MQRILDESLHTNVVQHYLHLGFLFWFFLYLQIFISFFLKDLHGARALFVVVVLHLLLILQR
jgi:hypothetical protein